MMLFLFFWYCCDDYFAAQLNQPWVGEIPWWVVLTISAMFIPFMIKYERNS